MGEEAQQITFSATDLVIPDARESKRQKTAETFLNILEGRIRNPNTRSAYKVAWRSFIAFCSEYKLDLECVKPYHFGLWLKRHPGGVATQRQHLAAVRLLFDHLLRHMDRRSIWWLVTARARACGLEKRVCCHSFRATGITEYMNAGGALDIAQRIAGHSELSTTKIYDRSQDRVTIAEIERVSFN